jgi:hypothetical protein
MEINHVLQLIYYIKKAGIAEIKIYPEQVKSEQRYKLKKIEKSAT